MKTTDAHPKESRNYGTLPLALFILGIIVIMIVLKLIFKNL